MKFENFEQAKETVGFIKEKQRELERIDEVRRDFESEDFSTSLRITNFETKNSQSATWIDIDDGHLIDIVLDKRREMVVTMIGNAMKKLETL